MPRPGGLFFVFPATAPAGPHRPNLRTTYRTTGDGRPQKSMKHHQNQRTHRVSVPSAIHPHPAPHSSLSYRVRLPRRAALALLALLPGVGSAFDPFGTPTAEETASFDALWKAFTLYKDDANPILQEFKLRGRYQGQYHWVDSDQGDADAWEDRRTRFGFDAKFFSKQVEVRVDFQSNDGFEDAYDRLVDAYVKWKPDENLAITFGRTKPLIGYYDWLQSTNAQPTFERSQIFNQLRVDRTTALTVEGKNGNFTWQAGGYSNDTDREFGKFGGAFSYGAGIGYDAKNAFGWTRADFRLDWLHSGHDDADQILDRYDDLVSATFWGQDGPWGIVAEGYHASGGQGRDGDVSGFFIQPTYDLVPKRLQLVGRYSYATGDGLDSVRRQTRYESEAPALTGGGRGDEYHALYLGAQYFIHGDKLKLLAGVEYAALDGGGNGGDYDGLTWLTGIRFSF
jgi:phosphate-selective porin OprO/OprP